MVKLFLPWEVILLQQTRRCCDLNLKYEFAMEKKISLHVTRAFIHPFLILLSTQYADQLILVHVLAVELVQLVEEVHYGAPPSGQALLPSSRASRLGFENRSFGLDSTPTRLWL